MEKDYELHNLLDSSAPDLSEAERQCFSIVIDLLGNKLLAELKNNDDHILRERIFKTLDIKKKIEKLESRILKIYEKFSI